ncbi:MAG: DMT family transporter [Acidobacteriota bacterium]
MTTATSTPTRSGLAPGVGTVALALLFWAGPSVIGKAIPLGAVQLVFFRGLIGVAWGVAVLYASGGRLSWRLFRYSFVGGIALGCDLIFFYAAIKATTVANATVISSVQPLLMVFAAPLLFGEKIRWPDFLASLVAIGGVILVVSGSQSQDAWSLRGDLLALCVLFAWGAYLVSSKRARQHLSSTEFTCGVMIFSMAVVTPLALWQADWTTPSRTQWLGLAFMAVSGWVGHVLMNWALERVPLWVGGTSALAVPVLTSALAAIFLAEPLRPVQILGMLIVLASLTVVVLRADKVEGG